MLPLRRGTLRALVARRALPPTLRLATAGLLAAFAALALSTSQAAAVSSCQLRVTSAQPSACWHPFRAGSPFNSELPADPQIAADNGAVQQHMARYGWSLGGSNTDFVLGLGGSRPVYFATPSDPVLTVDCTDEDGPKTCQGANGVDVNGLHINVPSGARPNPDWDAHMTIIETATGAEYDFWHTSISGSRLTAGSGAVTNAISGDGIRDHGDAANFALSAGLLRPSELLSGRIDHALTIEVPCTNAHGKHVGYTFPATGGWGQYCGQYWHEDASTAPALGQRFYLDMTDRQIAASGAPAWEKTIMTALAHYGAYIEDTNGKWDTGAMFINTQDPTSWTSLGQANPWAAVAAAAGHRGASRLTSPIPIPISKLELVSTCVTETTCSTNSPRSADTPAFPMGNSGSSSSRTSTSSPRRPTRSAGRARLARPRAYGRAHARAWVHPRLVNARRRHDRRVDARRRHHRRVEARRRHDRRLACRRHGRLAHRCRR